MPANKYFNPYTDKSQQDLYRNLIEECVRFYGLQSTYIPRISLTQPDLLFGDDPTKAFVGSYQLSLYLENTTGFDGPGTMFSKLGYVINKEAHLILGNNEWSKQTSGTLGPRPREGDLIWFHPFQAIHEIKFVEQDKFFYAFGPVRFYGWQLITEEFRYSSEVIQTGISEIDTKVNQVVAAYAAIVTANGNTNSFVPNEMVYQSSNGSNFASAFVTANVVSFNRPSNTLILKNLTGEFHINTDVYGLTTGADFILQSIETEDNVNHPLANNVFIRTQANNVIDSSESNPVQGNPVLQRSEEP